jgi:hypothetical protein
MGKILKFLSVYLYGTVHDNTCKSSIPISLMNAIPGTGIVQIRDAPDSVFAGYLVMAGCRISGRILGLTTIFSVKYQIN